MATGTQTVDPSTGKLTTGELPDTAALGQETPDTQQGIRQPTSQPGVQQDINEILQPYINELMNLGPEYGSEMEYLKPYLTQTGAGAPQTFDQVVNESKAQESPTGNTAVNEADESLGNTVANQQPPGFGELATAAKEYEGTVPYSQLLQTVLGAGKNEILYGTVPNISNIQTGGWPESLQHAYQFLTQAATGTNANSGLQSPTAAAKAAASQTAPNPNDPTAGPNAQGGGNAK